MADTKLPASPWPLSRTETAKLPQELMDVKGGNLIPVFNIATLYDLILVNYVNYSFGQ